MRLEGLEIDNNFTWTIVQALTSSVQMTNEANDDVDAQLAKKETTENSRVRLRRPCFHGHR